MKAWLRLVLLRADKNGHFCIIRLSHLYRRGMMTMTQTHVVTNRCSQSKKRMASQLQTGKQAIKLEPRRRRSQMLTKSRWMLDNKCRIGFTSLR